MHFSASIKKLARFWDSHDVTDFEDELAVIIHLDLRGVDGERRREPGGEVPGKV